MPALALHIPIGLCGTEEQMSNRLRGTLVTLLPLLTPESSPEQVLEKQGNSKANTQLQSSGVRSLHLETALFPDDDSAAY